VPLDICIKEHIHDIVFIISGQPRFIKCSNCQHLTIVPDTFHTKAEAKPKEKKIPTPREVGSSLFMFAF